MNLKVAEQAFVCCKGFQGIEFVKRLGNLQVRLILLLFFSLGPQIRVHSKKKTKKTSRVAQSVTCLATDASLTADPGVASLIPARSHTFVEIDHEIISTVILLPSAESFKKGCCQLQVCARSTG